MSFTRRIAASLALVWFMAPLVVEAQGDTSRYGDDARAGAYVQVADARLYYESYGTGGTPLVLLHGGQYGYIDEFAPLIEALRPTRRIIAIATRGYGRSDRGQVKLSHRQFAHDVAAMLDTIVGPNIRVDLLGFSEGAITGFLVAAQHPHRVRRLVAIGGSLGTYGNTLSSIEAPPLTPEAMQREVPELVAQRKRLMADAAQWEPFIRELSAMYQAPVFVPQHEFRRIARPVLLMAGDRDEYVRQEHLFEMRRMLTRAELGIVPGCGHVLLWCKPGVVNLLVREFLDARER